MNFKNTIDSVLNSRIEDILEYRIENLIKENDIEKIDRFLDSHDINYVYQTFHVCCKVNNIKVLKYVIDKYKYNFKSYRISVGVNLAAKYNNLEVFKFLLTKYLINDQHCFEYCFQFNNKKISDYLVKYINMIELLLDYNIIKEKENFYCLLPDKPFKMNSNVIFSF